MSKIILVYETIICTNCGKAKRVKVNKNKTNIGNPYICISCGVSAGRLKNSVAEQRKDDILYKYTVLHLSAGNIARELNLTTTTITSKLKESGIKINFPRVTSPEDKKIVRQKWIKSKGKDYRRRISIRTNRNLKLQVLSHYSKGKPTCVMCGIDDLDVLCLDHINGGGEAHRRTIPHDGNGLHLYWWIKNNNFPNGFQVLCLNCNWKKHLVSVRGDLVLEPS